MRLCLSTMPGLLSGTFSNKPIRCPCRLIDNTQRAEVQSLSYMTMTGWKSLPSPKWALLTGGMDRFLVGPKPATTSRRSGSSALSISVSDTFCQAWISFLWGVQLIWSLQGGILMLISFRSPGVINGCCGWMANISVILDILITP